jgi:colanic acid/amylovoran biosynthesis glycosyltransferase
MSRPDPRPAVSVVVPFAGGRDDALATVAAMRVLDLRDDDEVILSDNTVDHLLQDVETPKHWRVVGAPGEGSPARARNAGALAATTDWLLFLDSDCRPPHDLADRYFTKDVADIVGGGITSPAGGSLAERFAATRGVTRQSDHLQHPYLPYVLTANVLIRRATWRALGGFLEGIFSGEDVDFCWRAQRAGWTVGVDEDAAVIHEHRKTIKGLLKQVAVRSASATWLHRRWADAPTPPMPGPKDVLRGVAAAPVFALTLQRERAALKLLDAATALASMVGAYRHNRARPRPPQRATKRPVEIWADEFPVVSETFVIEEARALQALGHDVLVRAQRRPDTPMPGVFDLRSGYLEDDSRLERVLAYAKLRATNPRGVKQDEHEHDRWAQVEPVTTLRALAPQVERLRRTKAHVHVHFAAFSALDALRACRLAKRPWSLTAHAYDIYLLPRNLEEKLRAAAFTTSGCSYTVEDLKQIAGHDRVHTIVMGIDPDRFRRTRPHVDSKTVIAIGRLVEKKGFTHLIRAAADLNGGTKVVIVGDGPLRAQLQQEAERLNAPVELRGRMQPAEIRDELERAAVLAMPCVVAENGDRDSMPVVVKEALAMEIPVVASDEVGLPELVRPAFGRLVPPGEPQPLANALDELLHLTPDERADLGRAGRAHVIEHANVRTETAKLSALIESAASR